MKAPAEAAIETREAREAPAEAGRKDDTGKPRYSLLPPRALAAVVDVLEYGARKYSLGGWRTVPDARTRYYDAAQRHLAAWWVGGGGAGGAVDPESHLPHLAHATVNLLFLLAFEMGDARVVDASPAATTHTQESKSSP